VIDIRVRRFGAALFYAAIGWRAPDRPAFAPPAPSLSLQQAGEFPSARASAKTS